MEPLFAHRGRAPTLTPTSPFSPQFVRICEMEIANIKLLFTAAYSFTFTLLQWEFPQSTPTARIPDRRVTVRGNSDMLFAKHELRVEHTVASRFSRPIACNVFDQKSQPEL
ncbi:unnamed protein product [Citrullus colocynthis]|uniref:Uncharacterized protein n=1 Tax=Citrullus colocynthis TaxID=252529 RepID=A0ABP0YK91_9ROSI